MGCRQAPFCRSSLIEVFASLRTSPLHCDARPGCATRVIALEAPLLRRSGVGKLARTTGDRRDVYYAGIPVSSRSI